MLGDMGDDVFLLFILNMKSPSAAVDPTMDVAKLESGAVCTGPPPQIQLHDPSIAATVEWRLGE